MRIKLSGKIQGMTRADDGQVCLSVVLQGNVQDCRSVDAKKAAMTGTLIVKSMVADELKIGSLISIIVHDGFLPEDIIDP